jgi:Ni,Fe-hydrogenase maturation factor
MHPFIKEKIEIEVAIKTFEIINYIGQKLSQMIDYQSWKAYGKYLEELKEWCLLQKASL